MQIIIVSVSMRHTDANSKHWFTTPFFWRKVPESDARNVTLTLTLVSRQPMV